MVQLSDEGYWPLDLGDVVVVGDTVKGSVVQVDGHLAILWNIGHWQWANEFTSEREEEGLTYRIERREWELTPTFSAKFYNADGVEVPFDPDQLNDAVYEGTDF